MGKKMTVALFSALLVGAVNAQDSEEVSNIVVNWENPKEYTDVKPANESRTRFRERTLNNLDKYFAELGERLPEGHTLEINVTDLDLAGQVWPQSFVLNRSGGAGDVRLIKQIDIPRMDFSYTLKSDGQILKSADVKLKDMGFLDRSNRIHDSDPLRHEKRMLADWFRKEFAEQIASK